MHAIVMSLFKWDEVWKELLLDMGSFFVPFYVVSWIGGFSQTVLTIAVITFASLIAALLLPSDISKAFSNMQTRSKKCFAFMLITLSFYAVAAISPGIHLITGDFVALRDICLTIAETIESWATYVGLLMIVGFIFFTPLFIPLLDSIVDNPVVLCILLAGIAIFLGVFHISGLVTFLGICWGIIAPPVIIGIASITAYLLVWQKQVLPDHRWY